MTVHCGSNWRLTAVPIDNPYHDLIMKCDLQYSKWYCMVLIPLSVTQSSLEENREFIDGITGFEDSVRKCE